MPVQNLKNLLMPYADLKLCAFIIHVKKIIMPYIN